MINSVLVTGASPDYGNRNTVLRDYVAEGFRQELGEHAVKHVPFEVAVAAVEVQQPRLVLCFGSCMPDDADYLELRRACDKHGSALAFWLHDDPYEFDYNYRINGIADVVFSNDRWSSLHYSSPNVHHLALASSREAHWRAIGAPKDIEVFFCGVAFGNRIRLVRDLKGVLSRFDTRIRGDQWPENEFPFAKNRRLSNDELSRNYARSLVTLNMGRDFHYANERFKLDPSTPGPRTFEAAMAGTTQMFFVESLEILDYYVPDKEIVLYDSVSQFKEKLDLLMQDHAACISIARASQARTEADHTYRNRARSILGVMARAR